MSVFRREKKFIDNKEFLNMLVQYSDAMDSDEETLIPEKLGEMIENLIYNIGTMPSFNRYTYRDIMMSEAKKNCIRAIVHRKFKLHKKNPFAYFTTVVLNSFFKVISDEKRQSAIKNAMYEEYQITHANSRFTEANQISGDVYKKEIREHSEFFTLKIKFKDGKEKIFETKEEYEKYLEKRKEKEDKLLAKKIDEEEDTGRLIKKETRLRRSRAAKRK
jgi:hypothetical protein